MNNKHFYNNSFDFGNYNKLWSSISLAIGLVLFIWGFSFFIRPALLIMSGITLINYGLRARQLPSITLLIKHMVNRFY